MSKNFIFILVIIVLGVVGYVWYTQGGNTNTVAQAGPDEDIKKLEADMTDLRMLKTITLNTALFDTDLFRALHNPPEHPIPQAEPGRRNPFQPF